MTAYEFEGHATFAAEGLGDVVKAAREAYAALAAAEKRAEAAESALAERNALLDEIATAEGRTGVVRDDGLVIRARANLARILQLEQDAKERNQEIDELRDAVRHERLIADGLRLERAGLIKEAASLRAQVETLTNERAGYRDEAYRRGREAESLRAQLEGTDMAAQARVTAAEAERDAAKSRETLALATVQTLRAQVESLRARVDELDRAFAEAMRQRNKALDDIADIRVRAFVGAPGAESLRGGAEPEAAGDPVVAKARAFLSRVGDLLATKNRDYGNAATDPLRIFSKAPADAGIRVRIDDKLSRIARGSGTKDEDTVADLVGYLALLAAREPEPVVSLPSPSSPKTGRWKCRRCGKELSATGGIGSRWTPSPDARGLLHWCEDGLASSPSDRIGDAPEVTP